MRDHHRLLIAEAAKLGATGVRLAFGGKHPRLLGTRPDGLTFCLVVSGTPSRDTTVFNERARLRHILRG